MGIQIAVLLALHNSTYLFSAWNVFKVTQYIVLTAVRNMACGTQYQLHLVSFLQYDHVRILCLFSTLNCVIKQEEAFTAGGYRCGCIAVQVGAVKEMILSCFYYLASFMLYCMPVFDVDLSIYLSIYIYLHVCVCVCVCVFGGGMDGWIVLYL